MRIILSFFVIVFFCFISHLHADIVFSYNGHGGEFRYSADTLISPTTKIAGTPGDMNGSGGGFLPFTVAESLPLDIDVDGFFLNTVNKTADTLSLNQTINGSFASTFVPTGHNKQFDISQYTYYAFSVSTTGLYQMTFEADGLFSHLRYPVIGPSYAFAGTDSVFNVYDTALVAQNSLAKFGLSAGALGTNSNTPFNVVQPADFPSNSLTQYVALEAGKLYRADIFSYTYIGGDGSFSGMAGASNSLYITAVPEPASLNLLATAFSFAGIRAYRKRRQSAT